MLKKKKKIITNTQSNKDSASKRSHNCNIIQGMQICSFKIMDGNYAFQVATTRHYKVKKLCYIPNMWEHVGT